MAKVMCACIECEHNKNNQCRAKTVNLSSGHVHTAHQGFKQIWECRTFSISQEIKELESVLRKYLWAKEVDSNERL